MKLLFTKTYWDIASLPLDEQVKKIAEAGYEGIEYFIPLIDKRLEEFNELVDKHQLKVVAQIISSGNTVDEHLNTLEERFKLAATTQPLLINSQTGRDIFSLEDNVRIHQLAIDLSKAHNIPFTSEIHRSRPSFSTRGARELLTANPDIRLCADFSHWCCVHESLLQDQSDAIDWVVPYVDHIHARVGHPQGPQVSDPRAPEWQNALNAHLDWWGRIIKHKQEQGAEYLTITPEFGPFSYAPSHPTSCEPLADVWKSNLFITETIKQKFSDQQQTA